MESFLQLKYPSNRSQHHKTRLLIVKADKAADVRHKCLADKAFAETTIKR